MFWIYCSVLTIVVMLSYFLCRIFKLRKRLSLFLITDMAILSLLITYFYIIPHYTIWAIESKVRNQYPIIDFLAVRAPDDFDIYLKKIQKDVLEKKDVDATTHQFLNDELIKYYQNASNQSIYDYTVVIHASYQKLIAIDPILVLASEFPKKFPMHSVTNDEKEMQQVMAAKEGIIKSAIDAPTPSINDTEKKQAKIIVQDILLKLAAQYGKENVVKTFEHPNDETLDKKIAADILIEFYSQLIAKGVKDTGIAMKFSLSPP